LKICVYNITMINIDNCINIKNKKSNMQCTHKRYPNSEFCGIHKKMKIKTRYDDFVNNANVANVANIKIIDTVEDSEYYTYSDFRSMNTYGSFRLDILRNTMKKYNLNFNPKLRKKDLYLLLHDFFSSLADNKTNSKFIIKIQIWFRALLFLKRVKCKNVDDFYTNISKFDVPLSDVYIIRDTSSHYYWFNIDTFGNLIDKSDTENIKNPYTCNVIDKFYIDKFNKIHKNTTFDISLSDLTAEQICRNRALTIFQKINKLDNYADFNWFYELSLHQLKQLYAVCEDVWNYRAQLTILSKTKIVKNGFAFKLLPGIVHKYKCREQVRNLLLTDFDRLCCEGVTIDDKKVGAMLILTALVEISVHAANAMPQYVQGSNMT
jgi:hypothetical protein